MKINYITNPVTLGEKIRNRRLALGLTQQEASKKLGIERGGLVDWENNNTSPAIEFYPAIVRFLTFFPFEIDTSNIGGRVRHYRFSNGLSQDNFGKMTGIGPATIFRIEQGIGTLSKKTKRRLNKVLPLDQCTSPCKPTSKSG